ncbi:MAG: signal peptidase I [Kiritimatiellia bacterium]|jgi:signal peptidase I
MATFLQKRKARKQLDALVSAARSLRNLRGDLLEPSVLEELSERIAAARTARYAGLADLEAEAQKLSDFLELHGAVQRNVFLENFEVVVVAIAVAMAFRCYFFQPFQIPTGSMHPTLYGIHTVDCERPTILDRMPLKLFKWFVTGDWYKEVRVEAGGRVVPLTQSLKPGYAAFRIGGKIYHVPSDAITRGNTIDLGALKDLRADGTIRSGGLLWAGIVRAGDHVFVNRLTWNFRPPRRGDVMVFSTKNIPGLPEGTHYIKRMVGLPGESVSIRPPNLVVDGAVVKTPESIVRIARREKLADWAPAYLGYQVVGNAPQCVSRAPLRTPADHFDLAPDEYFALGDNTGNSLDSRYWGAVPRENLLGPGALVYWPFASPRWGRIE